MLASLIISIWSSVVAFVCSEMLTSEGMILYRANLWAELKLKRWLYKPLIGCSKCMAGQLALWLFWIKEWSSYDFMNHLFCICFAILLTAFIDKQYYK